MKQKKYICLFFVVSAFLFLFLFASCNSSNENTKEMLSKAILFAENGDWNKALKYAKKVYELEPSSPVAENLLVMLLEKNENLDLAIQLAIHSAETYPESFFSNYLLGRFYFIQEKYELAIQYLSKAEKLKPNDVNTMIMLGRSKIKLGKPDAIGYYIRLANVPGYNERSSAYNEAGVITALKNNTSDFKKSLVLFDKACMDIDATNPIYFLNIAIVNDYYLGDCATARSFYQIFLEESKNKSELSQEISEVTERLQEIKNW